MTNIFKASRLRRLIGYEFQFLDTLTPLYCSFQNFLYAKKDESSELKAIDFGLSDFVRPGLPSQVLTW